MRAVYGQDEAEDRGLPRRALRKLFKEDLSAFLSRLGRLEQGFQAKVEKAAEKPPEPVDEGLERSLGLCESLLAGYEAKVAAEDAEFAARPDAAAIGATLQERLAGALRREEALRKEVEELRRRT